MDPRGGDAIPDGETNDFRSSDHPDDEKSHPHTGDGASPGYSSFPFISCLFLEKMKGSLEISITHHLFTCKNVD